MSADFSIGGRGGAFNLTSGNTIGGSVSFFGGRGGLDRGRGVSIPSDIHRSVDSGSITMSSADTGGT